MNEFEQYLKNEQNLDPENFACRFEWRLWGDKVRQYDEEEDAESACSSSCIIENISPSVLHRERRERTRRHYKKLRKLSNDSSRWWCSGVSIETSANGKEYPRRYYRGQRSKAIKKACNRLLRRKKSLMGFASKARGLYRKATEFWWNYS